MRKIIKYPLLFLGSVVLIVPVSLYTWYRVEHNQWSKDNEISGSSYWNKTKTLWTNEGSYPPLFVKDPARLLNMQSKYDYYEPHKYSNKHIKLDINNESSPLIYSSDNLKNSTYIFKQSKIL